MPDLNPESLRRAAEVRAKRCSIFAPGMVSPCLDGHCECYRNTEKIVSAYLSTTPNPLRDTVGDLLHMHRQGDVSAEMWGRVQAAFDGGGV